MSRSTKVRVLTLHPNGLMHNARWRVVMPCMPLVGWKGGVMRKRHPHCLAQLLIIAWFLSARLTAEPASCRIGRLGFPHTRQPRGASGGIFGRYKSHLLANGKAVSVFGRTGWLVVEQCTVLPCGALPGPAGRRRHATMLSRLVWLFSRRADEHAMHRCPQTSSARYVELWETVRMAEQEGRDGCNAQGRRPSTA